MRQVVRSVSALVLAFCAAGLVSCVQMPHLDVVGRDIYSVSSAERQARFKRLSPDQQLDVYLFGMNKIHPPMMRVGDDFSATDAYFASGFLVRVGHSNDEDLIHLTLLVKNITCFQRNPRFFPSPTLIETIGARANTLVDSEDRVYFGKLRTQILCCARSAQAE